MKLLKTYYQNSKRTVWVLLVLFSLAPCTVKESLLLQTGITTAKTLNAAKTVASGGQCSTVNLKQYEQTENHFREVQKKYSLNRPFLFTDNNLTPAQLKGVKEPNSSGSHPPKYILYKRLKIALV